MRDIDAVTGLLIIIGSALLSLLIVPLGSSAIEEEDQAYGDKAKAYRLGQELMVIECDCAESCQAIMPVRGLY